jgi:hypothetical protein
MLVGILRLRDADSAEIQIDVHSKTDTDVHFQIRCTCTSRKDAAPCGIGRVAGRTVFETCNGLVR